LQGLIASAEARHRLAPTFPMLMLDIPTIPLYYMIYFNCGKHNKYKEDTNMSVELKQTIKECLAKLDQLREYL